MITYKFEMYHDGNVIYRGEGPLKDRFVIVFGSPIVVPTETDEPDYLESVEIEPVWVKDES